MIADPAAERAVAAGIFQYGQEAYLDVCDIVTPNTFTVDSNAIIYRCLEKVVLDNPQARPDLPSVLSAARSMGLDGHLNKKEEMQHLRGVMNLAPMTRLETVRKLAGKVRKLEISRLMHEQLGDIQSNLQQVTGDEPIAHILGLVENPIFDFTSLLANTSERGVVPMGKGALEYVEWLMDNPREMIGIPTGIKAYDLAIGGGIREEALDIIAARQKEGKTTLADNIGINIVTLDDAYPVLNVDTEMSQEQHQIRILGRLAGLDVTEIEKGTYSKNARSRQKLKDTAKRLADLPYDYLCVRDMEFEDVLAHMRRWLIRRVGLDANGKAKPCVILYDWLKLNSPGELNKNLAEHQRLGFITSGLKNFMGRYKARCICFSQLNREGIDTEDTSVIRGSDRILDFCTSFSLYKKQSDDEIGKQPLSPNECYTHKLIPLICRFGAGMKRKDYIHIRSVYEQGTVIEGPTALAFISSQARRPAGEIVVDDEALSGTEFAATSAD